MQATPAGSMNGWLIRPALGRRPRSLRKFHIHSAPIWGGNSAPNGAKGPWPAESPMTERGRTQARSRVPEWAAGPALGLTYALRRLHNHCCYHQPKWGCRGLNPISRADITKSALPVNSYIRYLHQFFQPFILFRLKLSTLSHLFLFLSELLPLLTFISFTMGFDLISYILPRRKKVSQPKTPTPLNLKPGPSRDHGVASLPT